MISQHDCLEIYQSKKSYNQGVNKVSYAITFISNGKILSRKCVNIKTNLGDAPIIGPPHRITTHHIQNTDIFKIPYFRKMPSIPVAYYEIFVTDHKKTESHNAMKKRFDKYTVLALWDYLINLRYLSTSVYVNCFRIYLNNGVKQKQKAIVISSGHVLL